MNIKKYNVIIILLIVLLMCGCGKKSEDDKKEKQFGDEIPYTDMSEYKGVGGCILENSVYDYTGVFDEVYDWGNDFKLPFPKPEDKKAEMEEVLVLDYMTKEEMTEYFKELEKIGFKTTFIEDFGEEAGLIYNEKLAALFQDTIVRKPIDTQEEKHKNEFTEEKRIAVWVLTGFVNNPLIEAEKVHDMIDKSRLLDNEGFSEYFIIPIENETVRKAGYYECLIFSEKYRGFEPGEIRPYYMVSDGENICLLEEYGYSPYYPSSANYMEKNGKKTLVTTSGYYYYNIKSSSGDGNDTCMFTYEMKDDKFICTEKTRVGRNGMDALYIGKLVDGEIKLFHLEDYYYEEYFGKYDESHRILENRGRYVIDKESEYKEMETEIQE